VLSSHLAESLDADDCMCIAAMLLASTPMERRTMRLLRTDRYVMTKGLFHQERVRHGGVCWEQSRRVGIDSSHIKECRHLGSVNGHILLCYCKTVVVLKTVCEIFEL